MVMVVGIVRVHYHIWIVAGADANINAAANARIARCITNGQRIFAGIQILFDFVGAMQMEVDLILIDRRIDLWIN